MMVERQEEKLMKIHDVIRTRRQTMGLTQEGLADRLGVSAPAVNKWEKGLNYPDITLLPSLARTLGSEHPAVFSGGPDPRGNWFISEPSL